VTEPAEQPAKPVRTWRPMALWTAGILLVLAVVVAGIILPVFGPLFRTFVDDSDGTAAAEVLSKSQAIRLSFLLHYAPSKRCASSASGSKEPDPGPPLPLAPTLCIDIYRDKGRTEMVGQILGFDRMVVVVDSQVVIEDEEAVDAIYKAVGR
jgi:hypothetical protein